MAFVMTVWTCFDIGTADIAPEDKRSRTLYVTGVSSYRTADRKNVNGGLGEQAQEEIFGSLASAELVSATEFTGGTVQYISEEGDRVDFYERVTDTNFWKLYRYEFLEGRPFDSAEMEAGMKVAVISESAALKLFKTAENVTGREIRPSFSREKYRVTGVVADVSSMFPNAFGQVWRPLEMMKNSSGENGYDIGKEGPSGNRQVTVLARRPSDIGKVKKEILENLERFNRAHPEYTMNIRYMYVEGKEKGARSILIVCLVLMIIPAVNSVGLMSSLMNRRCSEIGIRKAYGAGKGEILRQLIWENLFNTAAGAFIGLAGAYFYIYAGRVWLLSDNRGMGYRYSDFFDLPVWTFFRIDLILYALGFCLVYNFMSVYIPARRSSRLSIIETIRGDFR